MVFLYLLVFVYLLHTSQTNIPQLLYRVKVDVDLVNLKKKLSILANFYFVRLKHAFIYKSSICP